MLLTTPLTTFLNANLTAQLHTLLLLTPSGKLLSSASSHPASLLRAQATIASSIWSQYAPLVSSNTLSDALFQSQLQGASRQSPSQPPNERHNELTSILLQLDANTMVIRPLRCTLLLVSIGPSLSTSARISTSVQQLGAQLSYLALSSTTTTAASSFSLPGQNQGHNQQHLSVEGQGGFANGNASSAASEDGSVTGTGMGSLRSTGGGMGSLKQLKWQAEELAKWLEGELEGYVMPGPL